MKFGVHKDPITQIVSSSTVDTVLGVCTTVSVAQISKRKKMKNSKRKKGASVGDHDEIASC